MRAYPSYLLLRGLGSFAGACAFTLNLVYQVETVGLGPLQLVTGRHRAGGGLLARPAAHRRLRRPVRPPAAVIVGFLLLGTGALVEGLVPTYAGVLVGTAVWGVGSTCVDGAEQAWLGRRARRGPGRARLRARRPAVPGRRGARHRRRGACRERHARAAAAGRRRCWLLLAAVLPAGMPEQHFVPPPRRGAGPGLRDQLAGAGRVIRGSAGAAGAARRGLRARPRQRGLGPAGPGALSRRPGLPGDAARRCSGSARSASPRCSARCCSPKRCGGGSTRPGRGRSGCCWPVSSWAGWSPRSLRPGRRLLVGGRSVAGGRPAALGGGAAAGHLAGGGHRAGDPGHRAVGDRPGRCGRAGARRAAGRLARRAGLGPGRAAGTGLLAVPAVLLLARAAPLPADRPGGWPGRPKVRAMMPPRGRAGGRVRGGSGRWPSW